jgi:hypothetical protein
MGDMNSKDKYEIVSLSQIRQGRRGRHHELVTTIFDQLQKIGDGQAIKLPLGKPGKAFVSNLRAALLRAAASRNIKVGTYSEDGYIYVWRRTAATRRYERARRGG